MDTFTPIIFFPGEDEEALKSAFVELCAKWPNFSEYDVAKYIFRDLKDPTLRAFQAADYWGNDLAVKERIRHLVTYGKNDEEEDEELKVLRQIATSSTESAKDRIAAVRVMAEIKGKLVKAIDKKVTYPNGDKPKVASFVFRVDKDADKPPVEVDEDDDAGE